MANEIASTMGTWGEMIDFTYFLLIVKMDEKYHDHDGQEEHHHGSAGSVGDPHGEEHGARHEAEHDQGWARSHQAQYCQRNPGGEIFFIDGGLASLKGGTCGATHSAPRPRPS